MPERTLEPAASDDARPPRSGGGDPPPPFLGSWRALYGLVIAGLLAMIALCWAITRWGAR